MRTLVKWFVVLLFIGSSCSSKNEFDVVVYAGTPAGVTTAIRLAQDGKNVLLIEQTNHLGGMYAGGLMTAEIQHMQQGCISGLAEEYYSRLGYNTPEGFFHRFTHGKPAYFFECKTAELTFKQWIEEYKQYIQVWYALRITDLQKEGAEIRSITLNDGRTVYADYFVDCSYEGDLMKRAGVSYIFGRESQKAFEEKYAGVRFQADTLYGTTVDEEGNRLPFFREMGNLVQGAADDCVNAYNFRCVLTKRTDNQVPFTRPVGYDPSLYNALADYLRRNPDASLGDFFGIIPRGNGKVGFNTRQEGEKSISVGLLGMQRPYPLASYEERDGIRAFYELYTKGLFYFLSHDERVPLSLRQEMGAYGYAKDEFVENDHFPYYFYIRESLRLRGEYFFTEHDILTNRSKEDAILLGSHWLDCHSVQKIALSDTSYINEGNIWVTITAPYEINYRVMLPMESECTNLLVPVCVSSTHVAFSSIRLESTWMQLGHAAGAAIVLAMSENTTLHDINIPTLQQMLKEEGMVVKLNEL